MINLSFRSCFLPSSSLLLLPLSTLSVRICILSFFVVGSSPLLLQASVIFGAITIFGFMSWYFTPAENWLRREQVILALQASS